MDIHAPRLQKQLWPRHQKPCGLQQALLQLAVHAHACGPTGASSNLSQSPCLIGWSYVGSPLFSDANVGWVIQLYTKVWWSTPVFLVIWPLFASKKCLFTRSLPDDPHTWIVGDYSIPPPNQGNPNFGAWLLHSIFFVVNSHWTPFFWVRSQYLVGDIQCLLVKSTCLVMNSPNFLGKSQNFEDVLPSFASKIHPNLRKKRDLCDRGPRPNHLRQMKQLLRFAQHSLRSRAARCHVLELQVCPGCQFWFTTCSMPYIVYTSYPYIYIYIISIYIYVCDLPLFGNVWEKHL